jgi:hypothetical protein
MPQCVFGADGGLVAAVITDDERADLVAAGRDVADDLVERGYV